MRISDWSSDVCSSDLNEGVKIFRVDNPHTKPLPFWQWLIADVRAQHPEVMFLAEAFTTLAMMARLGKVGYSQSYTYFTWRNTKAELAMYFTELNERSEEHTSELQSLMRISYAVFCLKKKKK